MPQVRAVPIELLVITQRRPQTQVSFPSSGRKTAASLPCHLNRHATLGRNAHMALLRRIIGSRLIRYGFVAATVALGGYAVVRDWHSIGPALGRIGLPASLASLASRSWRWSRPCGPGGCCWPAWGHRCRSAWRPG